MELYKTVPGDKLKEDISGLQRSARSYNQIAAWFRHNLPAIGLPEPADLEDVSSSVYYDIGELALNARTPNPFVRASLRLTVTNSAERHPVLDNMFYVGGDADSEMKVNFKMDLYLDDWPMLAADLAASFFNDCLDHIDDEDKPNVEPLLVTFIPKHFPGLTWDGLKVMASTDLLPTNRGDYEAEFVEFLFNHTAPVHAAPLPATFEPCQ